MKIKITLLLIIGICLNTIAQNPEAMAKYYFGEAQNAYGNGDNNIALTNLQSCIESLGKTNAKIEALYTYVFLNKEDYIKAKEHMSLYFDIASDNHSDYMKMVSLLKETTNKAKDLEQEKTKALELAKITALETKRLQPYWDKAKKENTLKSYKEYIVNTKDKDINPFLEKANAEIDRFEKQIKAEILAERTENDIYEFAKSHNNIVDYEAYINKYPNGKYASEVNSVIDNSYYRFGNEAYAASNYSKAKKYYSKYISKFPFGLHSSEVRNKIILCDKKMNQRSASFLMYTYDSQSPIGISMGDLNKSRVGFYWNFKMNPEIFKGLDVINEIDDAGDYDGSGYVTRTGEVKYGNISLSGGVTFNISYPLWAYIGGGIGYFAVYEQVDTYFSDGEFWEEAWLKNTDQTKFGFFPEVGVKLKVYNALVLKYGIMYRKGLVHQFGFGIQI